MDVVAERLAKRLSEKDGTADDWALLARSYMMLNRYSDAVAAFDRALAKAPGNEALVADRAAAQKAAAGAKPAP
jgi:cytochrome c-type biogenesis protein CcmH